MKVAVFGYSKFKEMDPEYQEAMKLGGLLAEAGHVVTTGGYRGIMEAASRGAQEAGGQTVGVTTTQFPGTVNPWVQTEKQQATWRERIFALADECDAYFVFSGGTGTLAELFLVWEMRNQGMHEKPIVILGERAKQLVAQLKEHMIVKFPDGLHIANNVEEAAEILKQKK